MDFSTKKRKAVVLNILFGIAAAVGFSFLIFGTNPIYIADKMPPVDISRFNKQVALSITVHFFILLIPVTAIALPQTIILSKKGIFSTKKDIIAAALLWVLPIISCFIKLTLLQYRFTY